MSWMSQLGWKEGLSPSALGEIDKLELEIQRLSKEKSIKSLQFETLEAALDKKERR
ncbi:Major antigenlike, partial [Caligus rogercresseyi]